MKYLRCEDLFEYGDKVCSAEQEISMVSVLVKFENTDMYEEVKSFR